MDAFKIHPKDSLGFLTWKLSRVMTKSLTTLFLEMHVDVTVEQWRALLPVYKHNGMTQRQLCDHLYQEKTGVSRLVAALEKKGLLSRLMNDNDHRVKELHITDEGKKLIELTIGAALKRQNEMVEDIEPEDLETCKNVLWKLILPELEPECYEQLESIVQKNS